MKTFHFLFVLAGCGALAAGRSFADEPPKLPPPERALDVRSVKPAHDVGGPASRLPSPSNDKGQPLKKSVPSLPPLVLPKNTKANQLRPTAINKTSPAANAERAVNKTFNTHNPVPKPALTSAATLPGPGLLHGRTSAMAGIGGLTMPAGKTSTAALGGAALKYKP